MPDETAWTPMAAELDLIMRRAQLLAERYRQQAGQYGQSRAVTLRYQSKARQMEDVVARLARRAFTPGARAASCEDDGNAAHASLPFASGQGGLSGT